MSFVIRTYDTLSIKRPFNIRNTVADLDKTKFIFQNFRENNARPPKLLGGRAKFNAAA